MARIATGTLGTPRNLNAFMSRAAGVDDARRDTAATQATLLNPNLSATVTPVAVTESPSGRWPESYTDCRGQPGSPDALPPS